MSGVHTIAIAGCGAVTERYYTPSLLRLIGRARVVALFDTDAPRAEAIATHFPEAGQASSFEELLGYRADLIILASPPAAHASQAIAGLRAGSAILCEKPLAPTLREARDLATVARETDRLLAVNMVRRHFPSSRIVETLVAGATLGRLVSVNAFEGRPFRWPIGSQSYFSKAVSGGGVLADIGTHVADLLQSWLGEAQLAGYCDDAMGGVEANALLELRWGDATGRIRLSRDWERPNGIDLTFEKATMRWRPDRLDAVEVLFEGSADPLIIENPAARHIGFEDCFTDQIAAVLDHLEGKSARIVTADMAVPTVALLEQAYAAKRLMPMPWLEPYAELAHG